MIRNCWILGVTPYLDNRTWWKIIQGKKNKWQPLHTFCWLASWHSGFAAETHRNSGSLTAKAGRPSWNLFSSLRSPDWVWKDAWKAVAHQVGHLGKMFSLPLFQVGECFKIGWVKPRQKTGGSTFVQSRGKPLIDQPVPSNPTHPTHSSTSSGTHSHSLDGDPDIPRSPSWGLVFMLENFLPFFLPGDHYHGWDCPKKMFVYVGVPKNK